MSQLCSVVDCVQSFVRSKFISALGVCVLPVSAWLRQEVEGEGGLGSVRRLLQMLKELGTIRDYSTHCQVLANFMSVFFCLARRRADVSQGIM